MRANPIKCPKCRDYMEPKFEQDMGHNSIDTCNEISTKVEPIKWECLGCGFTLLSQSAKAESLISVKRESADSQNSPQIDNTNKEEANFS